MLILRQIIPLTRTQLRFYGKKSSKMATTTDGKHVKQVHKEIMRHINPYARINIRSDLILMVRSADLLDYPDADAFIAELHGGHVKNCPATMQVSVSDDEKTVNVVVAKTDEAADFHCELEVPIRAELNIEGNEAISVSNMYCNEVTINGKKHINSKDIRADKICLNSAQGNIWCEGLLLAKNASLATKNGGNISLEKLQGEQLHCRTDEGNISTTSCYVDLSKFETNKGNLLLKNIHKKAQVQIHTKGNLEMTGVHGNIDINCKSGTVQLQLSELSGDNSITIEGEDPAIINISERIETGTSIEINSPTVTLDNSLAHLSKGLAEDFKRFCLECKNKDGSNLIVNTRGPLIFGKLSWLDSLQASITKN